MWVLQPLVVADFNPPVINVLNEVFNETGGVRVLDIRVQQDNTGVSAEEIDILITVDGEEMLYDSSVINPLNSGSVYVPYFGTGNATLTQFTDNMDASTASHALIDNIIATAPYRGFPICGNNVKLEVRQTSAIPAGQRIRVNAVIELMRLV